MTKLQYKRLRKKADKIIAGFKDKDLQGSESKDLRTLIYDIEKEYQAGLEIDIEKLRSEVEELRGTLDAIRSGEVDALIVNGTEGEKVFTLSGAEHPYRIMVETMGEGAAAVSNDGTILFCNRSFARLVQLPLERITGSSIIQYVTFEGRQEFQSLLSLKKSSRLEYSIISGDGTRIPVYLSISPLEDPKAGFSIVVTDLTHQKNEELIKEHAAYLQAEIAEREKAEKELRESEQRYRSLVMDQTELICRFLPDGLLTFVNAAFCNMAEMDESKLIGKSFFMFLSDEDISRVFTLMQEVSPTEPDRSIELKVYVKDKVYWMSWNGRALFDPKGNLIEYQAAGRDITAQKQAEAGLRKSEVRFRSLFENSLDGVMLTSVDGSILAANNEMCRILGMSEEEIIKKGREGIVIHDEALETALEERRRTGQVRAELCYRRKEGNPVPVEISSGTFKDAEGLTLTSIIVRDISERKRSEEEINRRTAELESLNSELESFSYSVSHDLRAPLRAIDGFTNILLNEIGDKLDPESIRIFNVIRANSEKMNELIEGLLKLSRAGRAEITRIKLDMQSLVMNIWEDLIAGNPDRRMDLKLKELPPALGDRVLVMQVLSNLLGNAVKFTRKREHAVIEVSASSSDVFNIYRIKDNGTGFDMRYYDNLFKVFKRLHGESEYEGTGIGLAITKKIIEKHGGKIWAESSPGKGAEFFFTLPE